MTKRREQPKHDKMVKAVVDIVLKNDHTDVKADIKGYDRPKLICGEGLKEVRIPDVTSTNDTHYIFEVETEDSIDHSHTEDQWRVFSAHALQCSKKFIVVVPKDCENKAWARAKQLRITLDDVWPVS